METNLNIYYLKTLKGPDRLLRVHLLIEGVRDLETTLYVLASIIDALLFKHHGLSIDFPVKEIIKTIPKGEKGFGLYGEFLNGQIGLEILLRRKKESSFKIRHYPLQLEFERKLWIIENYIEYEKINTETYERKYKLMDFRNGFDMPEIRKTITYTKRYGLKI